MEGYKHRVITLLERKEMEFLDKMGRDSFFSTGHKLSYGEILKGLLDLAMDSDVSGEGVDSVEKLEEKLMQKIPLLLQEIEKEKNQIEKDIT